MNRTYSVILAGSAALAGGLAVVAMVRPDSLRDARRTISGQIQMGTKWAGSCLSDVQSQLSRIEAQLQNTSSEFAQRLAEVGRSAAGPQSSGSSTREPSWELERGDIARDLPRIPRH